ncbi:MAG: DUF2283 domain-containing protein [Chloroflexi bacterium]|nr:DUF2283 domain-containing protein [Chloroflexota bacterium]
MKVTYDPEVDALYIRLSDEQPVEVTTQRLSEEVAINDAPDGRIVGIEILDASEYISGLKTERKIALENLIPMIG